MKKLLALFFVLLISIVAAVPVFADSEPVYIDDSAGILSYADEEELLETIRKTKEKYGCDIGVYTLDVGSEYISDYQAQTYAEEHYNSSGFSDNGILLLIYLSDIEYGSGTHIATAGECIEIFTEDDLYYIEDNFYSYLVSGEYDKAIESFVSDSSHEIYDHNTFDFIWFLIAPVIGVIVAFIATGVMKGNLKTVHSKPNASDYTKNNSLKLNRSSDVFLYRRVTRTLKPQNTSSGSRSHSGAGGRSFGGHSGRRF